MARFGRTAAGVGFALVAWVGCKSDGAEGADCVPLVSVADQCPATWTDAQSAFTAFCATAAASDYGATLSSAPCNGLHRYVRNSWDAGPRYCLYDGATFALVGYEAIDGKARFFQITCGYASSVFDANCGSDGMVCPLADAGSD